MSDSDNYHHPDLRRTLLDEALKLLRKEGIKGFSLRSLAAASGVSHAAPYRHFGSKDAILAALLVEGHRLLATKLLDVREARHGSALDRLGALGRAYLDFARENPERLGLMFSRDGIKAAEETGPDKDSGHGENVDSFAPLEETVRECQAEGSLDPAADTGVLSMAIWSLLHGLALLRNEGIIDYMSRTRGAVGDDTVEGVLAFLRRDAFRG